VIIELLEDIFCFFGLGRGTGFVGCLLVGLFGDEDGVEFGEQFDDLALLVEGKECWLFSDWHILLRCRIGGVEGWGGHDGVTDQLHLQPLYLGEIELLFVCAYVVVVA
jgi:hypothetical protein